MTEQITQQETPLAAAQQPVPAAWPSEIRLAADKSALDIAFDDGARFSIPAELLRVESPSAEVQGHAPHEKITVAAKRAVRITGIEMTGNYAIRITFDDGHSTGIYPWALLYRYGRDQTALMAAYVDALKARGLSRD
ncbi:gamma-butyrobetaine hydroxylase family protein [Xanthobacter variabilis]|uniref:gamma-butyrobetaine hydroxylase-like domain-containing protein n=1 Tax=Xanthobacter variabilis TaxID=3119932 RepID=UPI00372AE3AA